MAEPYTHTYPSREPCPSCGSTNDVWEHYGVIAQFAKQGEIATAVLVCNPCGRTQTTVILPRGTKVEFK
jgi:C4-type Zn-finger protein